MNSCCHELYHHLPLLLSDIISEICDLSSLAAPQGSVVVAERIPRLPCLDWTGRDRVEFFVYHPSGDVARCLVRKNVGQHVMRNGCSLFVKDEARTYGVGEALHRIPPASVERLNSLAPPQGAVSRQAVTQAHMAEIFYLDLFHWCWRSVEPILSAIPEDMCPLNLTDGHHFPWWLWITGELDDEGEIRAALNELYMVATDDGRRHVIIDSESGYRLKSWSLVWRHLSSKLRSIPEEKYYALKGPDPSISAGGPTV